MKDKQALLAAALITIAAFILSNVDTTGLFLSESIVERVIDGDTIALRNGDRVRLLSIDTPERGQYYYTESKIFLERLVGGKGIRLETDAENKDKYGRLLRYVFADGRLTNVELVREGYARSLIFNSNEKYANAVLEAEKEAKSEGKGLWALDPEYFCIYASAFHFNAKGNDNSNLNDEYVIFKNKCGMGVEMTGWIVLESSNGSFIFPFLLLASRHTITLRSGRGENNATDLFWGSKKAVWNNNKDALKLIDPKGRMMLNYSYDFS
ncbi:MAG: thermonuclease family protein [Candidatus Aenigmarchaeota archaeon]|nr:thermonuclease family protein [Candidatus Aenigmarchaeota archaeon]